jgi:hypothetical protein
MWQWGTTHWVSLVASLKVLQVPLAAQAAAVVGHWLDEDPVAEDWGSLGKLAKLQRG